MVLGLGSWEIVFVGLALLVMFGPEHAPQAIRKAGEMQAKVRRALRELEDAVEEENRSEDGVPSSRGGLPSSTEQDADEDETGDG